MEENFYQITNNICKQICKNLNITQANYSNSFLSKLRNAKKSLSQNRISLGNFFPNLRNLGPVCKFHVEPVSSGQTSPALSEPEFEDDDEPSIEDVDSRIIPANIYQKHENINSQQRLLLITKIPMNADLSALRKLFEENHFKTRITKCFYQGSFSFVVEFFSREDGSQAFSFLQKNNKTLSKILINENYEIFYIFKTQKPVSEFAIVFRNLPQSYGTSEIKILLQETLSGKNLGEIFIEEICLIKSQYCTFAFVENIEDAEEACYKLNKKDIWGYRIKVHPLIKGNIRRNSRAGSHFKEYFLDSNNWDEKSSASSISLKKLQEFKNQVKSAAKASNSEDNNVSSSKKRPAALNIVFQDEAFDSLKSRPPVLSETQISAPVSVNTTLRASQSEGNAPVYQQPKPVPVNPPALPNSSQTKSQDINTISSNNGATSNQIGRPKSDSTFFYSSVLEDEQAKMNSLSATAKIPQHRSNNILALDNQHISDLRKMQIERSDAGVGPANAGPGPNFIPAHINAGGLGGSGKKQGPGINPPFVNNNQGFAPNSGFQPNPMTLINYTSEQPQIIPVGSVSNANNQNIPIQNKQKNPSNFGPPLQFSSFEEEHPKASSHLLSGTTNWTVEQPRSFKQNNNQSGILVNPPALLPVATASIPSTNPNIISAPGGGVLALGSGGINTTGIMQIPVGHVNQAVHGYAQYPAQNISQGKNLFPGGLIQGASSSQSVIQASMNPATQPSLSSVPNPQISQQIPNPSANLSLPMGQNTSNPQMHQQPLPQIVHHPQNISFPVQSMGTQQPYSPSAKQSLLHKNQQSLEFLTGPYANVPYPSQDMMNSGSKGMRDQIQSRGNPIGSKKLKTAQYSGASNFISETAPLHTASNDLIQYSLNSGINSSNAGMISFKNNESKRPNASATYPNVAGQTKFAAQAPMMNIGQFPVTSASYSSAGVHGNVLSPKQVAPQPIKQVVINKPYVKVIPRTYVPLPSESPPKLPILPTESPPKPPEQQENPNNISAQEKRLLMNVCLDDLIQDESKAGQKNPSIVMNKGESKDEKFKKRMAALAKLKKDDDI